MIRWPGKRPGALLAGVVLIIASNAIALLGVAWNRAGTPDSQLVLSERELQDADWWRDRENSGITLDLHWRIPLPTTPIDDRTDAWRYTSTRSGPPHWLTADKMRSLGFALPAASEQATDPETRDKRLRSREVLLVLELDGPDRQRSLQAAQARHKETEALAAANPDKSEFKDRLKHAHDALREEQDEASRLFAIDAGLDHAALRARYADRSRYVIVRARVRPWMHGERDKAQDPAGFIQDVLNDAINVPQAYRLIFERKVQLPAGGTVRPAPFAAVVAFGQRLEPWLVSAQPADKSQ